MMKCIKKVLLFAFLFLLLAPVKVDAAAETLGDLRRAYEDLVAEKRAYDNQSQQAKDEIASKQAAIRQSEVDLSKAEEEEEETKLKIADSNEKIEQNKKEAEKVLTYMQQMQSRNAYVEYVTGSSSMTELVTRMEAVKQVTDYIQTVLNDLETEIKRNEELVVELEAKQKDLSEKIVAYEAKITQLYNNVEEYNESSLSLDDKISTAKEEYEYKKKQCKANLGKDDDSVKLADCSKVISNGAWLKPLTSGVITSTMGYRTHPVTGQAYKFHDAVDIGVGEGTPIYAAAAGEVVAKISRSSCGGNKLYINVNVAGNNYTTYYYHLLRFNVNVGDIVDQNTIIGYVGGYSTSTSHGGYDGCTTGAHLHFGVQTGFYSTSTGVQQSRVIVPPGFGNYVGYRFSSRYDYYGSR